MAVEQADTQLLDEALYKLNPETDDLLQPDVVLPRPVTPPINHRWWYRLLVTLVFAVLIAGGSWSVYTGYKTYMSWYNASLQQTYAQGKTDGIAIGMQQGIVKGAFDQQVQDAIVLTHTKAADAKSLSQAKITAYQSGKQDDMKVMRSWWFSHCRYDSVITSYVCSGSP